MVPARSSRHGISCSRHLSRSQAEIPLIPPVQISRASSMFHRKQIISAFNIHFIHTTIMPSVWTKSQY
ncbi:hypothetical protein F9K95_16310 [Brucella anthropi]|nr:hypothetical protein F9K95_16310 [Brucella anthropi]